MEDSFRATGWLGITISDHLYLDFSPQRSFNDEIEKLIRRIQSIEAGIETNTGK